MLSRHSSASPPSSPKRIYLEDTSTFSLSPPPRSSAPAWHSTVYDLHAGTKRAVDRKSSTATPPSPLARPALKQGVDHSNSSSPSPVPKDYSYGFPPRPVTPPLGTPPKSSTIYNHFLGFTPSASASQSSTQAKKVSSVDNLKKSSLGTFPPSSSSSSSSSSAATTTTTTTPAPTNRLYFTPPMGPPPPPPPPSASGTKDRPRLTVGVSELMGGSSGSNGPAATCFNSSMNQTDGFEPDDEWKKSLRSSIQSRLSLQIDVAKQERHRKLIQLSKKYAQIAHAIVTATATATTTGGGGGSNSDGFWGDRDMEKEKASRAKEIEEEFAKSIKSIRVLQEKMFEREVERERMERRKKANQVSLGRGDHLGQTTQTLANGIPTSGGSNGVVSRSNGTEGRKEKEKEKTTIGDHVSRPIVNEDSSSDEEENEAGDRPRVMTPSNRNLPPPPPPPNHSKPPTKLISYPPPAYPPQPPTEQDTLTPLPGSYPPEPSKYPPSSIIPLSLTTRSGFPPVPPPPLRVPVPPFVAAQPINTDPARSSSDDSDEYDFGSPMEGPDGEESFYIDSVGDGGGDVGDEELFLGEEDWEDVGCDVSGMLGNPKADGGEKTGSTSKDSTKPRDSSDHSRLPSSSLDKREDEIKVREAQLRVKERDLKMKADELSRKEEEIKKREEEVRAKEKVIEEREARRAKAREELLRRKEQESANPPPLPPQQQQRHHHHQSHHHGRTAESRDPVGGRISVAESPSRKTIDSTEDTTSLYEISRRRACDHHSALRSSEVGGSGGASKNGFAPPVTRNGGSGSGSGGSGGTRPYSTASDFAQRRGQVSAEKKASAAAAAGGGEEQASSLMDSSVNWHRFSMWQNS